MRRLLLTFALFSLLALSPLAQRAQAWVGVRLGIGLPIYVGPGPYYYGNPYYYPPTYVAPAPVIYQPAPSVSVVPAPASVGTAPANNTVSAARPPAIVDNVIPTGNQVPPQIDALVRQLSDASETVRRDAALEIGRLKARNAVDVLTNMLAKDPSPVARDGAARALGLMASPQSLNALIYAAQADDDREVRHSAQFAVEIIRSNLRGN
jgi:hypothetical protein